MRPNTPPSRMRGKKYTKTQKITIFGRAAETEDHLRLNEIRNASRQRKRPEDLQRINGKLRSPIAIQLKANIYEKYFQKERGKIQIIRILTEERRRIGKIKDPFERHEKLWQAFYRAMKNNLSSNPDARALFERTMNERLKLQILKEACREEEGVEIEELLRCLEIGVNLNRLKRAALRREEKRNPRAGLNPKIGKLDKEALALEHVRLLVNEFNRKAPERRAYPTGGGKTLIDTNGKIESFDEIIQRMYKRRIEIPAIKSDAVQQILIAHRERLNEIIGIERARMLEEYESATRNWIRKH